MQGRPTDFWGKLRRKADQGPVGAWHPLFDHCADVAAVFEALVQLPIWRQRLERLGACDLDDVAAARLCVLAALHDLGKLNIGFQAKGRPELGCTAGHVTQGVAALSEDVGPLLVQLESWGPATACLLVASICHHGRPYKWDAVSADWQKTWWRPKGGLDPLAGVAELMNRSKAAFPEAFARTCLPLPSAPGFSHAFAGLVMLADWVASDTRFFPFSEPGESDRAFRARALARSALVRLGLDVDGSRRRDASGRDPFARVAPPGYRPRAAQQAIVDLPCDRSGSITILEAETGSGKTEAALARFVTLFDAGLVDGLYFALPTRTAATQMHRRVLKAVRQAFADPPPVVLAVPGYLDVDDVHGKKLPGFEVLWPDQDRFRYRAWAAENSKRYLAAPIAVGTIDQVLLSALLVGHSHLRAAALLRHLLVVDEVHASDAYMSRILREVLNRHVQAGGHALLLSATLGGEARTSLLAPGSPAEAVSLDAAVTLSYPALSHAANGQRLFTGVQPEARDRSVGVRTEPWLDDAGAVAAAALSDAVDGAKVLIIKNTVAACIQVQEALERAAEEKDATPLLFRCGGVPAPHHSRFARPDRETLDDLLEKAFGKERPAGGLVVVATQTVQQSLDLDADVLYTDLCPSDVMLQRLGRLHRHERDRPRGFEQARSVVMVPTNRDLGVLIGVDGSAAGQYGLGRVYSDLRMLEATWRLLEEHAVWRIPAMNRLLVERSLHSTVLHQIVEQGGEAWRRHAANVVGAIFGQRRQADLNLVDWSKPYAESCFPTALDQRITSRLGEGDRRVCFAHPVMGPFGNVVGELTLRAYWAPDAAPDQHAPEELVATARAFRFLFGGRGFVYDRLGLRPVH